MKLDRRQILKGLGLGAGAFHVRSTAADSGSASGFTHGVASGDPLADRVIIWSRYVPAACSGRVDNVIWQVAYDRSFGDLAASGVTKTSAERDFTIKVDATGLKPGRRFFIVCCQRTTLRYRKHKTLPKGAVGQFRMGVASCSTTLKVISRLRRYRKERP